MPALGRQPGTRIPKRGSKERAFLPCPVLNEPENKAYMKIHNYSADRTMPEMPQGSGGQVPDRGQGVGTWTWGERGLQWTGGSGVSGGQGQLTEFRTLGSPQRARAVESQIDF